MKNYIISIIFTTLIITPLAYIGDLYLLTGEHVPIYKWAYIILLATSAGNLSSWLMERFKRNLKGVKK